MHIKKFDALNGHANRLHCRDVVVVLTSPLRSVCTMKAVSEFSGRRVTLWLSVPGMNELNQRCVKIQDVVPGCSQR